MPRLWGAHQALACIREQWDADVGPKAPQISAEVVAGSRNADELAGESDLHRLMAAKMDNDAHPLGGYSGGPLVLFAKDGVHLIGIIKEGGFMFGAARAFCSPIENIARLSGLS